MRMKYFAQWLYAVALLLGSEDVLGAADIPVTTLRHQETFVVPSPARALTRQVFAKAEGIYYLQRLSRAESRVVLTDQHGKIKQTVMVSPSTVHVDADPARNLVVLELDRTGARIKDLAPTGTAMRQRSLARPVNELLHLGDRLAGVRGTQMFLEPMADSASPIVDGINHPYRVVELPDRAVAVISAGKEPNLRIVKPDLTVTPPIALQAPEIKYIEPPTGVVAPVLLYSVAATPLGHILCAVGPYPDEHALIVQFNPQGRLVRRFRALLPPRVDGGVGRMHASHIVASGTDLYIISATENQVARYLLPTNTPLSR